MNQAATTPHPWIIAGVALVGASAVAAAPVASTLPSPHLPGLLAPVALTAGGDLDFSGWTSLFSNTEDNVKGLFDHATGAPLATLQQSVVNGVTDVKDIFTGHGDDVFSSIGDQIKAGFQAPFEPFAPGVGDAPSSFPDDVYSSLDTTNPLNVTGDGVVSDGLYELLKVFTGAHVVTAPDFWNGDYAWALQYPDINHLSLFELLNSPTGTDIINALLPGTNLGSALSALLNFTASPLSGVLWGGLGSVASPLVQLFTDGQQLIGDLQNIGDDPTAVLNDLVNDPANILNAALNGTTLPLTLLDTAGLEALVSGIFGSSIGDLFSGVLNATGADVSIGTPIALGGLLSGGGSLFDALGLDATGSALGQELGIGLDGAAVGPIGSLIELDQAIASAIGWDLDGSPLADLGSIF